MNRLNDYIDYWKNPTVDTIDAIDDLVTPDFTFIHPFEELHGLQDFKTMMRKMFRDTDNPRLKVLNTVISPDEKTAYITWDFLCRPKANKKDLTIRGVGEITIAPDGRIAVHHDHWDSASQLLWHIPVVGWLVKQIFKKLAI